MYMSLGEHESAGGKGFHVMSVQVPYMVSKLGLTLSLPNKYV